MCVCFRVEAMKVLLAAILEAEICSSMGEEDVLDRCKCARCIISLLHRIFAIGCF